MSKRKLTLPVLVFLLTTQLFALQAKALTPPSETTTPYRIGVLYWSMNIPGQVAMRRGLEATAEKLNTQFSQTGSRSIELIALVAGDGPEGIENQIRQMDSLIDLKPDLIIVQPTDNAALAKGLLRANLENIPVVAYDQYISGKGKLACFLTSNNYQAGFHGGEYIAHRFKNSRNLNIVLVEYPHVSSTVERVNGFIDGLTAHQQLFRIIRTYVAVEPVAGRNAGRDIRNQHPAPGSIDVIFTVNDGGGLAVVQDLYENHRVDIQIATVDGDPASVENIRNNKLTVIDSAQFCWHLGANALLAGYQILQGREDLPPTILLPVFPITSETLDLYAGWYGGIPEPFTKPWASRDSVWQWQLVTPDGTPVQLEWIK